MCGISPSLAVAAGTSLLLVLAFLAASALAGWYEERARRAVAAVARGAALRRGFGAFKGEARPIDGRPGGLLVQSTLTQVRFGGGAWRDSGREVSGAPFALVLDGGEEIEVDPRDVVLQDQGSRGPGSMGVSRDIVARLGSGDVIWATGVLTRPRAEGTGAYRSGRMRRRLVAPRGGRVTLGPESPLPRWQALARAHQQGGYLAACALAVLHVAVYRSADVALFAGKLASLTTFPWDARSASAMRVVALLALGVAGAGWRKLVVEAEAGLAPGRRR